MFIALAAELSFSQTNLSNVTLKAKKRASSEHIVQYVDIFTVAYEKAVSAVSFLLVHFPIFVFYLHMSKFLSILSHCMGCSASE